MNENRKSKMEQFGRSLSGWLSERESRVTKGRKKLVLLLIVILAGSYCLFLVAGNGSKLILGESILFPKIGITDSKIVLEQRIKDLDTYLDSLKNLPAGRQQYDSLLKVHPHIYDSIAQWKLKLEQLPGK